MASSQVGPIPAKLSFAKVAAMRAPSLPTSPPPRPEDKRARLHESKSPQMTISGNTPISPKSPRRVNETSIENTSHCTQSDYVATAIQGLSLVKETAISQRGPQSAQSGESLEDDQSHLSSSSTKQQSFDTKSMASVTTFAMDEKESIRPDDSASVRAAEDDDAPPGPVRELSFHRDLEASAPALGVRAGSRPNTSGVTIAARRYHTLTLTNPPRFGDLPVPVIQEEGLNRQPRSEVSNEQPSEPHERAPSLPVAPDEKLLDALASPKDRLSLLQLEERFLAFISNPGSEFLDLPPQNSFARLLAYKLADYYSLAHHINDDGISIRVLRTPSISMPTPLYVLAQSIPAGAPQQPPLAMAFKIMRRSGLGPRQGSAGASTPASSSVPSKATSDAGLETNSEEGILSPIEGTPNKDKSKLTREEREAQYKAARDRIFGDFQESVTSESASTGENSASLSRSSSSSGKRKARKQKIPKDDTFEARSAFIPSYAPMHVPQMQPSYPQNYAEQAYQGQYSGPNNGYGASIAYGSTPTQSYPNFDPSIPYSNGAMAYGSSPGQPFSPADSWSSMHSPSNGYLNYPASPPTYPQNMSTAMPHNQFIPQSPWVNNQFQASYQQPHGPPNPNMNGWSGYPPASAMGNNSNAYSYGQVPVQNYAGNTNASAGYNASFAAPGASNYSRSLFNPQTRSFVPSNAPSRNGGRNNNNNNNSNNGRKKLPPASSQMRPNGAPKPYGSEIASTQAPLPRPTHPKEDTLQQKYGAPAHLPKKPPPSRVPSSYDVDSIHNAALGTGSGVPVSAAAVPSNGESGPASGSAGMSSA